MCGACRYAWILYVYICLKTARLKRKPTHNPQWMPSIWIEWLHIKIRCLIEKSFSRWCDTFGKTSIRYRIVYPTWHRLIALRSYLTWNDVHYSCVSIFFFLHLTEEKNIIVIIKRTHWQNENVSKKKTDKKVCKLNWIDFYYRLTMQNETKKWEKMKL